MRSLVSSQVSYFHQELFLILITTSLDVTLEIATLFQATSWPFGDSQLLWLIILV